MIDSIQELRTIYNRRFGNTSAYRNRVWKELTKTFFSAWVDADANVLDLGCGYGEFINNIKARNKFAMDLNPDAQKFLNNDVNYIHQDCSSEWQLNDQSLDVIFSSNFFEHLPDKNHLRKTLQQAYRCLKPGGVLIALGPNIKYLSGVYWDFFDHQIPLSESSLAEALEIEGFTIKKCISRFLPYTLVNAPEYPVFILKLYVKMPFLWWIKGRQFLIVAVRSSANLPSDINKGF